MIKNIPQPKIHKPPTSMDRPKLPPMRPSPIPIRQIGPQTPSIPKSTTISKKI